MKLPRGLARFNRAINNPIQRKFAWLLPPWAVIHHRGRRSGRAYRTPVLAFRSGGALVVALLYGEESDWVRNLRAGGGEVVRGGRTYPVTGIRVLATASAGEPLAGLSRPVRAYCRAAEYQAVLELGDRRPGVGPRPRP